MNVRVRPMARQCSAIPEAWKDARFGEVPSNQQTDLWRRHLIWSQNIAPGDYLAQMQFVLRVLLRVWNLISKLYAHHRMNFPCSVGGKILLRFEPMARNHPAPCGAAGEAGAGVAPS
jgi:hypothetical protein